MFECDAVYENSAITYEVNYNKSVRMMEVYRAINRIVPVIGNVFSAWGDISLLFDHELTNSEIEKIRSQKGIVDIVKVVEE